VLPLFGKVFVSVLDADKPATLAIARRLVACGFRVIATTGTAEFPSSHGIEVERVNKVREGSPHSGDAIHRGEIAMVINTPEGVEASLDSFSAGPRSSATYPTSRRFRPRRRRPRGSRC
jgi:carbamoyl-phosphate synthase large subunit